MMSSHSAGSFGSWIGWEGWEGLDGMGGIGWEEAAALKCLARSLSSCTLYIVHPLHSK
jgi:hypothetical protein